MIKTWTQMARSLGEEDKNYDTIPIQKDRTIKKFEDDLQTEYYANEHTYDETNYEDINYINVNYYNELNLHTKKDLTSNEITRNIHMQSQSNKKRSRLSLDINEDTNETKQAKTKLRRSTTKINYVELEEEEKVSNDQEGQKETVCPKNTLNQDQQEERISTRTGKPVRSYTTQNKKTLNVKNKKNNNQLSESEIEIFKHFDMASNTNKQQKTTTKIPVTQSKNQEKQKNELNDDLLNKLNRFGQIHIEKQNKKTQSAYTTIRRNNNKTNDNVNTHLNEAGMSTAINSNVNEMLVDDSDNPNIVNTIMDNQRKGNRNKQLDALNKNGVPIPSMSTKRMRDEDEIERDTITQLECLLDSNNFTDEEDTFIGNLINKLESKIELDSTDIDELTKLEEKHKLIVKNNIKYDEIVKILEQKLTNTDKEQLNKITEERLATHSYSEQSINWINGTKLNVDNIEQMTYMINWYKHTIEENELNQILTDDQIVVIQSEIEKITRIANPHSLETNTINLFESLRNKTKRQYEAKQNILRIENLLKNRHLGKTHSDKINLLLNKYKIKIDDVNDDEINEMLKIDSICQTINDDERYYARVHELLYNNTRLENLYPSEKYNLIIKGEGIFDFENDMKSREKEIIRCTGIKSIRTCELIRDKTEDEQEMTEEELNEIILNETSGTRHIYISVTNYSDYRRLMSPWPSDAFVLGVKPFMKPMDDVVLEIKNIEKDIDKEYLDMIKDELELEYGVVELKRMYFKNDKSNPTTTLIARILTLTHLINACYNGIRINPKYRNVKVKWLQVYCCSTCGTLEHFNCSKPRCIICGKNTHTTAKCDVEEHKMRCINCKKLGHRCDQEKCHLLRKKKYEVNDYLLSVLLGEGIMKDASEILRNPDDEKCTGSNFDENEVRDIVKDEIDKNSRIKELEEKTNRHEQELNIVKNQLSILAQNQEVLGERFEEFSNEIRMNNETTRIESAEKHQDVMSTLVLLVNTMTKIQSDTKSKKH